jgi:hypothetical protein
MQEPYFYMVAGHQDTHPITPISADLLMKSGSSNSANGMLDASKLEYGALVRKKTGPTEYSFYRNVFGGEGDEEETRRKEQEDAVEFLRSFIPKFYASLSEMKNSKDGASYVVMENILYPFIRSALCGSIAGNSSAGRMCIMDLKLGSQLYEPSASHAKKEKMIKKSLESTSSSLGLRICGMMIRGVQYKRDYCLALKR